MKLSLAFALIAIAIQQTISVDGLAYDRRLARFFENPDWQQSLSLTAPVISPEETLGHLKKLKGLIPKNRNKYLDDEDRATESFNVNFNDEEWDINETFEIMRNDLKHLIDYPQLVSDRLCGDSRFKEFWSDTRGVNYFSNPGTQDHYGPNMEAYFMFYKKKNFDSCVNHFLSSSQNNVKSQDLKIVDDVTRVVFQQLSITNPKDIDQVKTEASSIANALMTYINSRVESGKRPDLKKEYYSIMGACVNVINDSSPNGFLEVALDHPEMNELIMNNPVLRDWSGKIKVCRYIHAKIRLDDLEGSAGYTSDVKGKIKNIFHRH